MKVGELIKLLQETDQETEVLCYLEDDSLADQKHKFRLLDIVGVKNADGIKVRGDDGIPSMKFDRGAGSQKHLFIDVTFDF